MARQSLQPFSTNVTESSKKIREKVDHRNDPASDKNKVKLVKPELRSEITTRYLLVPRDNSAYLP